MDAIEVPDGTEVVDAAGKTVIPGLVDLHAHYGGPLEATEQALRAQLYYGVTTTRSIGSDNPEKATLMLEANAGRPDLPRAFTAGLGFLYPGGFEGRKVSFRQVQEFVKTLHDNAINVALGTDIGTPNVPMGWGTHHELELYVEAGLTPMETLVAATATGAGRMPPVGEADFGTLTSGMSADLIVLDADPLADIRNTLQIDRVMLRGEWVDRDALLPAP